MTLIFEGNTLTSEARTGRPCGVGEQRTTHRVAVLALLRWRLRLRSDKDVSTHRTPIIRRCRRIESFAQVDIEAERSGVGDWPLDRQSEDRIADGVTNPIVEICMTFPSDVR